MGKLDCEIVWQTKNGKVCYYKDRCQPYTVYYNEETVRFCTGLEEAIRYAQFGAKAIYEGDIKEEKRNSSAIPFRRPHRYPQPWRQ